MTRISNSSNSSSSVQDDVHSSSALVDPVAMAATTSPSTTTATMLYDTAVMALSSPLHQSVSREAMAAAAARRTRTVADMHVYLSRIGMSQTTATPLIHVTGTKGKGSTACLCETLLRKAYGLSTGLFTSPHLVSIRERIRVNGKPVSKSVFGQVYWDIRRRLEEYADADADTLPVLPGYFRMLTLIALYTFEKYQLNNNSSNSNNSNQKIDCIILEVGMGGRYDATNCLTSVADSRVVRGITLIDYDHCRVLGNTLPEIAWEKAGIFQVEKGASAPMTPHPQREAADVEKREHAMIDSSNDSSPPHDTCFALDTNVPEVLRVIEQCALTEGHGARLRVVDTRRKPWLPPDAVLGLPGEHQRHNAELALQMCASLMMMQHSTVTSVPLPTPPPPPQQLQLQEALAKASWPGRCQTVPWSSRTCCSTTLPTTLRLDGAHTVQSMTAGVQWYRSVTTTTSTTTTTAAQHNNCFSALFFYCSHERNPVELLQLLVPCNFDAAYFCTPDSLRPSAVAKATAAELLTETGLALQPELMIQLHDDAKDDDNDNNNNEASSWQTTLAIIWKHLEQQQQQPQGDRTTDVASNLTVTEAMERCARVAAQQQASKIEVFVTGSLYLVGSALETTQWEEEEAPGTVVL